MGSLHPGSGALGAYDALASHYDDFTSTYCHERWVGRLERVARGCGLEGRDAFDVACGTGESLLPLLRRGYRVTGCDLSPRMVDVARSKVSGRAATFVADMRALPAAGRFDLVTCLDDALNYLTEPADLLPTFRGMARNLAPGGLIVFDVNSLATYRTAFATRRSVTGERTTYRWRGQGRANAAPGELSAAEIEFSPDGVRTIRSRHVQRHHPAGVIVGALERAGLRCLATYGQSPGAELHPTVDETRHTKVVYVAGQA